MKRQIKKTADGSVTIHLPEWDEHYHSKHGAISEAIHVFIRAGLDFFIENNPDQPISLMEIGFGTGLNAFLTFLETKKRNIEIDYVGVEAYPVKFEEIELLNYAELLSAKKSDFDALHDANWNKKVLIETNFNLTKRHQFFKDIEDVNVFNLIYFDAFGARVQPDLWTEVMFSKMYEALKENGVLVTYAAKGSVRRAMQSVGLTIERLPGPPGKREMLRAVKRS